MLRIKVTQTRHPKSAVSLEVFILLLCKIAYMSFIVFVMLCPLLEEWPQNFHALCKTFLLALITQMPKTILRSLLSLGKRFSERIINFLREKAKNALNIHSLALSNSVSLSLPFKKYWWNFLPLCWHRKEAAVLPLGESFGLKNQISCPLSFLLSSHAKEGPIVHYLMTLDFSYWKEDDKNSNHSLIILLWGHTLSTKA